MSKVDKYTKLYTKYKDAIEIIDRLIVLKSEIKVHKESLLLLKRINRFMDTKCYGVKNFCTDVFIDKDSVEMSVHKAKHLYNKERFEHEKLLKEILKIKNELKLYFGINPKKLQVRKLKKIRKSFLNKKIDYSELVSKTKRHSELSISIKGSKFVTKQLHKVLNDPRDTKHDKSKVNKLLTNELDLLRSQVSEYNSLTFRIRAAKSKLKR